VQPRGPRYVLKLFEGTGNSIGRAHSFMRRTLGSASMMRSIADAGVDVVAATKALERVVGARARAEGEDESPQRCSIVRARA
jgi:hypothetical protein